MTSWQRRARAGVVVFGVLFAVFVYWSLGERRAKAPQPEVERLDPKATLEMMGGVLQQVRGIEQEYQIKSERSVSYEDRSARHFNVEITVPQSEGRSLVVTAEEGLASQDQVELQLSGSVTLVASDGFRLETGRATFNQNEAMARAPGTVTFARGRMRGSGADATYDQRSDVLQLGHDVVVTMRDESGETTLSATANSGTLDRRHDRLVLAGAVRVLRGSQVMVSDYAAALLSSDEEVVTYTELRGSSRVEGGRSSIGSMVADDIDLDYTEDGVSLERVLLARGASLNVAGRDGSSSTQVAADTLDARLESDGTVTSLNGRDNVDVLLPMGDGGPARRVRAFLVEAAGEPGRGLSAVTFERNVEFVEGSAPALRTAGSRALSLALVDGLVTEARFTGGTTFVDADLRAMAPTATYRPEQHELQLAGGGSGAGPRVDANETRVEARTITVNLDGHGMAARGDVRTSLVASSGHDTSESTDGALPRLLQGEDSVSVNATDFDYDAETGLAVYTRATLWQGDTALRGDTISLDRRNGDLLVSGGARSTLFLDGARSDGQAEEIRYNEADRTVTYSGAPLAPRSGSGRGSTGPALLAQLSGPQGDLRAGRIEVILARDENHVERLEAYADVRLVLGPRTATGERLTYYAEQERYVMSGPAASPVTIRDACRETIGRTLTFYASTDRIVVDGAETSRTETRPCTPEAR